MANRLKQESSPYLLQHADNPVDWYPWGDEALQRAKDEDKPIFLSIGYAACHWCHVMAHESFEDPAIAEIMNEHFINIKVDREERPDIDSLYMDAVVAMSGSGGWPMSVFLTPEGEPFFGGTYFPPDPRHGLPSFRQVLLGLAESWQEDREQLLATGSRLTDHLRSGPSLGSRASELEPGLLQSAKEKLHERYDWTHGGWGGAPKFPQSSAIEFLFRRHHREDDKLARDMAAHALRKMAAGGIYDHLGGGFARYSVDRQWIVPHFEKMLYDNALLLRAYLHGWQVTGEERLLQVAEQTLEYLQREMLQPDGGYASSLDADTEGEEGKFYVWTPSQIEQALEEKNLAELFMAAYGVTEAGNFEGKTVLHRAEETPALAERFDLSPAAVEQRLAEAREDLRAAREGRTRPNLDDKVLTAWNGLLLRALAVGAQATGEARWLAAAQSLANFLLDHLFVGGELKRSWRQGRARFNAYLEDHAALGLGLLELYATDFNPRWFAAARARAEDLLDRFQDPEGGFFDTPDDHEELLARPKSLQDSPVPSGNTLAVGLLQRLAVLEGDERYSKPAERAIAMLAGPMRQHPTAFAGWLTELDFALGPTFQLALVGDPTAASFQELASLAQRRYRPDLVLAGGPLEGEEGPALVEGRERVDGEPTAYLCKDFACKLPTTEPAVLASQLEEAA